MLKTPVGRLRLMSILDALSWVYLSYRFFYLKLLLGQDINNRIPGMIHGALFTIYGITLLHAMIDRKWSLKTAFLIGLTSIIPFAPFFIDKWLAKEERKSL